MSDIEQTHDTGTDATTPVKANARPDAPPPCRGPGHGPMAGTG